ncbi:P1 family peptidase [Brevibacterium sp. XM4083]|uniref:P1 family peptidase n=1 Tax=Brevibacterium sp. XM4083 TaxID=2583238 RepID=UPI00112D96E4|nr:P1 family peptidase [Brevibacterium sp. XM4083]MCM1012123.1 P1 family peptidase [Brevibacterium sp. XM4083]
MIPTPIRGRGLLEIPGIGLGHAGDFTRQRLTGVTALVPPPGSTVGVDVRGGGPATHETDVIAPGTHAYGADAIVLTGGSAIGLRTVAGVSEALAEAGRGFPAPRLPDTVIPLVPAAALYDLGRGSGPVAPPTPSEGTAAVRAALAAAGAVGADPTDSADPTGGGDTTDTADPAASKAPTDSADCAPCVRGSVGGAIGARIGFQTMRGGLGSFALRLPSGHTVAALVALNALGTIGTPDGTLWASPLLRAFGWDLPPIPGLPVPESATDPEDADAAESGASTSATNTTLAIVATDAVLDPAQTTRMAASGHAGIARAILPSHTHFDGDTVFSISTGTVPLAAEAKPDLVSIHAAAADAITLAMIDAAVSAVPVDPSWDQPPTLTDIAPAFTAAFTAIP